MLLEGGNGAAPNQGPKTMATTIETTAGNANAKKKLTVAEQVAERFHNDGSRFIVAGLRLHDVATGNFGAKVERTETRESTRYTFPDGSVITVHPGGWDLGFPGCWCWQSTGHLDDCTARSAP